MVVVDRVDLGQLDELLDLDRAGLLGRQRVQLPGLDHDVAFGRDLESLDDLLVGNLFSGLGIDALLGDAHARLAGQLVEADRLAVQGAVELHRDAHQSEADRAGPHRAGHRRK